MSPKALLCWCAVKKLLIEFRSR